MATQDTRNNADVNSKRPAAPPVLEVTDLRKEYATGGEPVHALCGVSLTVLPGEFVAIMGASGSGKSTLLHLIGGLDEPSAGSILVEGQDFGRMSDRRRTLFRRRRIGLVFQAYNLLPTMTAAENVALPSLLEGTADTDMERKAEALLEQMDLGHRLTHRAQALSGGEQQRVAIARALMNDPGIILADEPTGNLDTQHSSVIWSLLASLVHDNQRAVIAVTHEAQGATFADRVIVLKDGTIAGEIRPGGEDHASLVAARYRELVG